MNSFQGPMQPFPDLERWSRQAHLPGSQMDLFFYDTGGDAQPPVLLVHGLGDEADTWRHVLPLIAATHRAIAPDLPGFGRSAQTGRSDAGRHPYTVPFFVDTLIELLDSLSIARTVLVGHSLGAVIAQTLALKHPERVEKLVLMSGSLVAKENPVDASFLFFLIPGLGEWSYNRLRKAPQAAYRSLEPFYNRLEELPQADRDFLYRRVNERVWSDGQRRGFLSTIRALVGWMPAQQKGLPDALHGWKIPTTVLWGENDRIQPIANCRALSGLLPSARVQIVPGAGHNLQQEKPEVVAEAITQ